MKDTRSTSSSVLAMSLALCMGLASCERAREHGGTSASLLAPSEAQALPDTKKQPKEGERQVKPEMRPEVEKQRKEAVQQGEKTLDKEAIAAITETRNALKAIAEDKRDEAAAALERATGKVSILLARNPAAALIPVQLEVDIIDVAPVDIQAIKEIAKAAERAVEDKNYPVARVVLFGLTSEIRSRVYNLPLATYPAALGEAARLLEQKKTKEAGVVLQTALNTLVVIDRVRPLPIVAAQAAISEAQALREKDRDGAQRLLATARHELERAKELGYAGNDPEYAALHKDMSDIEAQLKNKEDATSAFAKLKDRIAAFFKRQSESERR
ncbi:YfdX family protein [Sorangium sp. So ce388]|uniref:YfdX family protein n=1 Tax=Sorangium sp. So ce388 TaxID=3133309 RepID=UPI003F5C4360